MKQLDNLTQKCFSVVESLFSRQKVHSFDALRPLGVRLSPALVCPTSGLIVPQTPPLPNFHAVHSEEDFTACQKPAVQGAVQGAVKEGVRSVRLKKSRNPCWPHTAHLTQPNPENGTDLICSFLFMHLMLNVVIRILHGIHELFVLDLRWFDKCFQFVKFSVHISETLLSLVIDSWLSATGVRSFSLSRANAYYGFYITDITDPNKRCHVRTLPPSFCKV